MIDLTPFKNQIGLDISDFKMRFIQLAGKNEKNAHISAFGEVAVPDGYIINGQIKKEAEIIELLKSILLKPNYGKITKKYVNASLPEKQTFIKIIEIPEVPNEEIKGAVGWGIEQNIPVSLKDIYFDWQVIRSRRTEKTGKMKVLAAVSPKNITEQYTRIIKAAGLVPIGMENESVAICRCLIDQSQSVKSSLMIIDMGRSRTNLIIYGRNTVQLTSSIEISGHEMTENVARAIKLSFPDAEKAKIIYGLDKRKGRGAVRKILEPTLNRLAKSIKERIDYFNNYVSPEIKINTIILTGSVSQTVGLPQYLNECLKMNVLLGDPLTNLPFMEIKEPNWKNNSFSFTTAIGLALKKFL